ncbi:MAG: DNA-processing protein DprA [Saprospiraceae bacterium]
MNDLIYKVALTKIPLVGAVTAKNLVSYCGGAREVFETKKSHLLKIPGVGERIATSILQKAALEDAETELGFIENNGIRPLFYLDKNYPQRLRQFNDAPIMLYYKGTANLNFRRTVAIVGTRTPSPQGLSICEEIVEDLVPYSPLVVSGLAYGIDVAAHRKCLEKGLETIAVLGHGLSRIYPPQHRKVALDMCEQGGLLTEFASHVGPERENFPMRNRIVAGLSDALIVVETATRGGSIITAQQANGYSREVFAVPGRVKDKFSQGCHFLIKNNLATLIENVEDVAKVLRWEKQGDDGKETKPHQPELFLSLTEDEKKVVDLIQHHEEIGVDQLSYQTKVSSSELASLLLNLEFKGVVRSLPGKRYVLC